MNIKLGKTSKLGKDVVTFGLPAGKTCPGAIENGKISDVCRGCYAKGGHYRFHNVKDSRERNLKQTKERQFVSNMVDAIYDARPEFMRWFDSGDIYSREFADKVYAVCVSTPTVKHWIASRVLSLPDWQYYRALFESLPNVRVRSSYGGLDAKFKKGIHTAIVVPDSVKVPKGAYLCPATENRGTCGNCKACWDKKVKLVAYRPHGQAMSKVVKEKINEKS